MAGVRLEHIFKKYPGSDKATVVDINLDIKDKEFLVLVGPSGCGKSTTLRMIAGLEEISEGKLYIGDRVVNDVAPKDRDIAMVFQSYALYPHMSVYQNMAFGLKLRKVKKDEIDKRVREAAKILDIEHLLERKPKALSGGQRQRVALGRAIVRDPQVFLMDEPLSNLDAKLRGQMRAEITKLAKRLETTVIYVTHDQIEAMTMGDRIVVMKDGIIQQAASPEELYNLPANLFVAGFIGSPTMNFISGKLAEQGTSMHFIAPGVDVEIPQGKAQVLKSRGYIGKEVILGVRPEDIHEEPVFLEASPNSVFSTHVDVTENLGHEMLLYLSGVGNDTTIARVDGRSNTRDGSTVKMAIDMNKVHIFDKETEVNVLLQDK
ncbi:sn-glycerol-3-phosphate ABC transporter ATP-binding protein UgpC [Paenibacillus sp. FSL H7-0942]|jgi:multiple sugar transport system ATP-binding protein|uniref:Multiple sugar transport system ATP-binding protein n=3 Tax=Paenibacillus TaxID=44249 RepID=A0ABS4RX02_PAEXY|nr:MULTISPECIES: sn-glycerol-3-phosphate ABC transporter ATP-binding protein UgpC [Paenibacillus]APO43250.1 glycerol-3-phosphate ABC transporter ATP-binding protein [Paenibacillus xylanexedens]ETT29712.1 multiple sugar-binding transport ATP-binding protein msmX [Paenibacillus sp. FSL R5-192]ETT43007.1 multiple sugar-binding transport ATP-binding protein msmX [Paenibacillus sp. FSL H7-689]KLU56847.1 glycerol-3-phosphate ABC transporter ATP-binding protein [Paenibacillus sp. VT-400]MBD8841831.1 